jgi:uncharacterized membrane protein YdjX (TVP38/TMEM64 family)
MPTHESSLITPVADVPAPAPWQRAAAAWLAAGLLALVAVALAAGPGASSVWEAVRFNLDAWREWAGRHPAAAVLIFFAAYAGMASLPLPVATVMSLLAGCLFGRWLGTGVASLAYATGVTVAFLAARGLLRGPILRRFGDRLGPVERGLRRDGAYYLLTLRLMPAVPFFLVSWLMALTPIRTPTYTLISWVGMLPLTFLCASVGTELMAMESPGDAVSPPLLASLVALAVAPLLIRYAIRRLSPAAREEG